jgi:hypothetical protein
VVEILIGISTSAKVPVGQTRPDAVNVPLGPLPVCAVTVSTIVICSGAVDCIPPAEAPVTPKQRRAATR